jgi:hypothetical protein
VSEPEHPAAKAGRLVRAVGLGIARERVFANRGGASRDAATVG